MAGNPKIFDERKHKRGRGGKFARKGLTSVKANQRSLRKVMAASRNRKRAALGKPPISARSLPQSAIRARRARTAAEKLGLNLSPADQKALSSLKKGERIRLADGTILARSKKGNNYRVRS